MKIAILTCIALLFLAAGQAQDTFSIVAIDTITGEIGSAGASCIDETAITGGAIIISDVLPGRGAIHTQSYWNGTNQQNAHNRMVEGLSPQEIIDWLVDNDVSNNPGVRQYGIVDLDSNGHPRSAAWTGANCLNYKNHITGPNYSIQGNILLGQQILDSIEARFLNTEGSFPEKMMAALQGANVVGADSRCTDNGTSSLSAFIRIARPTDTIGAFYCDLNVPSVPEGMEPIDSLQTLFDAWFGTTVGVPEPSRGLSVDIYPNPASDRITISTHESAVSGRQSAVRILNVFGQVIEKYSVQLSVHNAITIDISKFPVGIYLVVLESQGHPAIIKKIIVN